MAFVALKGEKKLADLVRRVYGALKAADAKRAEAALLRANPQLATLGDLTLGALIVVPHVPGLRTPVARTDTPAPDVVTELRDSLEAYRTQLSAAGDTEQTSTTALSDLLKSKEVTAVVREMPESKSYVDRVKIAAKTRASEHDRYTKFLKVLATARADLDQLIKKLS